ncbi:MAG: hypothetical protein J0L93_11005 [Deltaproteobacteria bacterium]|nr:hypothetical protein [Deltaproteobacteria bacterium]
MALILIALVFAFFGAGLFQQKKTSGFEEFKFNKEGSKKFSIVSSLSLMLHPIHFSVSRKIDPLRLRFRPLMR